MEAVGFEVCITLLQLLEEKSSDALLEAILPKTPEGVAQRLRELVQQQGGKVEEPEEQLQQWEQQSAALEEALQAFKGEQQREIGNQLERKRLRDILQWHYQVCCPHVSCSRCCSSNELVGDTLWAGISCPSIASFAVSTTAEPRGGQFDAKFGGDSTGGDGACAPRPRGVLFGGLQEGAAPPGLLPEYSFRAYQ